MAFTNRLLGVVALAFALGSAGCGLFGSRVEGANGRTCGQLLPGGQWRMVDFRPDRPMDPTTLGRIRQVQQSLRLRFNGRQALTTGPGLYHINPYQIANDSDDTCVMQSRDDQGRPSQTNIKFFSANRMQVLDRRSALTGTALYEREPDAR